MLNVTGETIPLAEAINITPADLAENQRGRIGIDQRRTLSKQRLVWIAGSIGFLLISASLLVALLTKLLVPTFAERGELLLWVPVALFWMWVLRLSLPRWRHTNHELRQGALAVIEGRVQCDFGLTFGLVQLMRYRIRVADRSFQVSKDIFFQFKNHARYRVFYSPYSETFLGALPLAAASGTSPPASARTIADGTGGAILAHAAAESDAGASLTRHELDILRLIAAGRSNKEIAGELSLSVNTIKMYTSQLYRKLGVRRRTEAVALARQKGLL